MKAHSRLLPGLAGILVFTGCDFSAEAPAPEPEVPGEAASPNFEAAARELQLGGDVYLYMDTEGVFAELNEKLSRGLKDVARLSARTDNPALAMLGAVDTSTLMADLGLTSIHSLGMSSTRRGGMYHNRTFIHTPEGPAGLLAIAGGGPHPFGLLEQAPEDADLVFYSDFAPARLTETIRKVAAKLGPASGFLEMGLQQPVEEGIPLTWADIALSEDAAMGLIVRLNPEERLPVPGADEMVGMEVPGVDFFYSQKLAGYDWGALVDMLRQSGAAAVSEAGERYLISFPELEDTPFALAGLVDTQAQTFCLASTRVFLDEVLEDGGGLRGNADFRGALEGLPAEGNSLMYFSPRFFQELRKLEARLNEVAPESGFGFLMMEFYFPLLGAEPGEHGYASVSAQRADGLYTASNWPHSHRATLAMGGPLSQVWTSGILSAMAIPAFNKVRERATEKRAVNDGRQIGAAAMQYFMEFPEDKAVGIRIDPASGEVEGPLSDYLLSRLSSDIEFIDNEIEVEGEFSFRYEGTVYVFNSEGELIERY